MSHAHRFRYPLLVSGLLLALYLLLVQDRVALPNRAAMALWNLAHLPLFFLLTVLFDYSFLKRYPRRWTVWLQFLLPPLVIFAVGTEALQALTDRQPSWRDVVNNCIGVVLACLWLASSRYLTRPWATSARVLVLLAGMLLLSQPLKLLWADQHSKQSFPQLGRMESAIEPTNWSVGARRSGEARDGQYALQVQLPVQRFAGTTLRHFPSDWQRYQQLHLSVFNPGNSPLNLSLRIHDRQHERGDQPYHDRFNYNFVASPGWTDISLPLNRIGHAPRDRQLNLSEVAALRVFYPGTPPEPIEFLIDSVYLD